MSSFEVAGFGAPRTPKANGGSFQHPSTLAFEGLLNLMATLLGMSLALDRIVPLDVGPFTVTFMIGLFLGALGFSTGVVDPLLGRFFLWAAGFSIFAVTTVLVNGQPGSLKTSAGILIWFLLVPGIATLCLNRRRLRSLLLGLVFGSTALLLVVVWRFARGARLLDVNHLQLLGVNRNGIDISIVWMIAPVLWSKTLAVPRIGKALFVGAAILWLTSSEGRTGLIALLLVVPVFVLLRPGSGFSRLTRFALIGAVLALLYVALTTTSIPGLPATQRIVQYESGDRKSGDQIRLLLNEKSLALARRHPVTGVGFGLYEGQYDPVIEKAQNERFRQSALVLPAHNTYYEVLATTGVPGFLLFLGMLLVPLIAGIRFSTDDDVRALTAGYIIVLFAITFHTAYGVLVALPLVAVLTAVARAVESTPPRSR